VDHDAVADVAAAHGDHDAGAPPAKDAGGPAKPAKDAGASMGGNPNPVGVGPAGSPVPTQTAPLMGK
jgi:hypothetical protein